MPNCNFYALPDDWLDVVRFIFSNDGWILYELASELDCEVRAFRSAIEVEALLQPTREHYNFMLYSPDMGGRVEFRRITLNPDAVPGKTFRYSTEGAGLILFYVAQPHEGRLRVSHTNHISKQGAEKWSLARSDTDPDWNWPHVTSMSNRLNRHIRSLAVAKHGSQPILAGAQAALDSRTIGIRSAS